LDDNLILFDDLSITLFLNPRSQIIGFAIDDVEFLGMLPRTLTFENQLGIFAIAVVLALCYFYIFQIIKAALLSHFGSCGIAWGGNGEENGGGCFWHGGGPCA